MGIVKMYKAEVIISCIDNVGENKLSKLLAAELSNKIIAQVVSEVRNSPSDFPIYYSIAKETNEFNNVSYTHKYSTNVLFDIPESYWE